MVKRTLVTGGAGFMGSHVAKRCLELGHEVTVLDDLSGGFASNVPSGAEFVEGSITDADLVSKLFSKQRFTYVYHLAAYAAEGLSHFIRRYNYQNNLIGSVNLINASVNEDCVERFVFTSSIAVYGSGQTPMTEDMAPQPEDPYGTAKYAVELDLACAHEMFGLNYTIFRPHNVYGEHQNMGDRYRNVIGIFMNKVMQGEPMTVFGDGLQTRAFTYIDDIAPLIAECVNVPESKNEVFNVGSTKPSTVLELANLIAQAMNKEPSIVHLEARNEVVHAFSTSDKVERIFGPQSYTSLAEGIERSVQWGLAHGPRKTSTFSGVEVMKNMPPSWKSAFNEDASE